MPRSLARVRRSAGLVVALVLVLITSLPASAASSQVRTSGPRWTGAVALTFDDGISRSVCARIARTLRDRKAKGTFFINGTNLRRKPARWRRILRGHAIANHTLSHVDLTRASNATIRYQIHQNEVLHKRLLGRPTQKILRPPYGAYDSRVRSVAGSLGYRWLLLWNVDTLDWSYSASVSGIIARATGARPGSVILMHCSRRATADALPAIIRHYKARGIKLLGIRRVLGL